MTTTSTATEAGPVTKDREPRAGFLERMYNGEGGIDFVGRRRRWFGAFGVVIVLCLLTIAVRGFSLGIDFEGGTRMTLPPSNGATESSVGQVFQEATGVEAQSTQSVGSGDSQTIEITSQRLSDDQIREARTALFDAFHPQDRTGEVTPDAVGDSTVSESWGSSITQRMALALGVFLLLIFAYIAIRFERDMAVSAIVALLVDLIVVSGIYSLVGFEVSPATIIGLLTILAYSLYDTVVVFDKVRENTADVFGSTRSTYGEQVNLAVNQTIMRSINTSLFSVVPIASLLVVAVWMMGVGTLKDLALVQLIGVVAGTFSSIFLASPLLVTLKSRQKRYREHDAKVARARELAAQGRTPGADAARAEATAGAGGADAADGSGDAGEPGGTDGIVAPEPAATEAGDGERRALRRVSPPEAPTGDGGRSWRPGM